MEELREVWKLRKLEEIRFALILEGRFWKCVGGNRIVFGQIHTGFVNPIIVRSNRTECLLEGSDCKNLGG
jgi:hypothetical protein